MGQKEGVKMNTKIFELQQGEKPLDNIKENCGFAGIFKEIGVIGDSLSSGEFESTGPNGEVLYHDFYEYSWAAILERLTGTKYSNYSRGGMSFKEFYESWADKNNFWQKKQAYIISLGNNDLFVFNQAIGSAKDINLDDPSKNPDTYFGYMGKVISKLKSLQKDARIFLVSLQIDHISKEKDEAAYYVCEEMKKVVKMFSFTYLLDMTHYGPLYDEKAREKFAMGFHPNAMGYYVYALAIGNYIDYIIRENYRDFFEVPFIGTNFRNKNI